MIWFIKTSGVFNNWATGIMLKGASFTPSRLLVQPRKSVKIANLSKVMQYRLYANFSPSFNILMQNSNPRLESY